MRCREAMMTTRRKPVDVGYFNDRNTLLDPRISDAEKHEIVNSTDYRVKVAVNMYRLSLEQSHDRVFAVKQAACDLETDEQVDRFLEVMLALEMCGQNLIGLFSKDAA